MEKEKLLKTKKGKLVSGTMEQTSSRVKNYSQSLLLIGTQCLINKN